MEWDAPGNITGHQLFAKVYLLGELIDPNPSNNTTSTPFSIYFVDFKHDRDAYQFPQTAVGKFSVAEIQTFLQESDIPYAVWNPLMWFFSVVMAKEGAYCYGMSDSSLAYFFNNGLIPGNVATTYLLTLNEAKGNIHTYQWISLITFIERLTGQLSSDPTQEYRKTVESIIQLILLCTGFT